jgi:hypothetical protein
MCRSVASSLDRSSSTSKEKLLFCLEVFSKPTHSINYAQKFPDQEHSINEREKAFKGDTLGKIIKILGPSNRVTTIRE